MAHPFDTFVAQPLTPLLAQALEAAGAVTADPAGATLFARPRLSLLGSLAAGIRSSLRSLRIESLRRTVDCCSSCGATVEHDADGPCCDGAAIEQVEVWAPQVSLGIGWSMAS